MKFKPQMFISYKIFNEISFANFCLLVVLVFVTSQANAVTVTRGWQNFSDGDVISGSRYNSYQFGETYPFSYFIGADPDGPNFSGSWTYNYTAEPYSEANIELALYDYDCFSVGCNVISSFTIDGVDFTSAFNSQISPGSSQLYSIFVIDLSSIASSVLADGSATVSLMLQPDVNSSQRYNGAGIDFANLTLAAPIPIPAAAWLFGSGLLGLIGVAIRKRS